MQVNEVDLVSTKIIRDICPYCGNKFKIDMEKDLNKNGLSNLLIKPHAECGSFIIFSDVYGKIRGIQAIDHRMDLELNTKENVDLSHYIKIFEDQENISDFYYILKIDDGKLSNKGVITSKYVKYHQLLRTEFFREWIKRIYKTGQNFMFMYCEDAIICTVNLYDMILFSMGIEIQNFDKDLKFNEMTDIVEYLKVKTIALGEKVLSSI